MKTTPKLICTIPDPIVSGIACTATCAVTNNAYNMYILKSRGSSSDNKQYPISIIKVAKFSTSPKVTTITVKKNGKPLGKIAKHANSICYARPKDSKTGSLYVTTSNDKTKVQVIKMSTSGVVEKELYYYDANGNKAAISLITFYGIIDDRMAFIVNGGAVNGQKRYRLAYLDDDGLHQWRTLGYGVDTTSQNYINNDFTYANGIFYHCFYKKNNAGIIKFNKIYAYDFSDINALVGQNLTPIEIIKSDATSTYDKKYEVEGIIEYEGKLYVATNSESSNSAKNKDTVFRLDKK